MTAIAAHDNGNESRDDWRAKVSYQLDQLEKRVGEIGDDIRDLIKSFNEHALTNASDIAEIRQIQKNLYSKIENGKAAIQDMRETERSKVVARWKFGAAIGAALISGPLTAIVICIIRGA